MKHSISLTINGYQANVATLGHALYHLNRHVTDPGSLPRPEALSDIMLLRNGVPMTVVEQRRPSGRVFGICTAGSENSFFLEMIDEIDREVMRVDGILRAPHEMTFFDWMAVTSVGSAAYNVYPCFPGDTDAEVDFMSLCQQEFHSRFGHGHNGPLYDGQQTNARHDVHVAYALMYGKPVPEDVVEWYREGPGLRKGRASDLGGFEIVLALPELRGALTPEQFRFLSNVVRAAEKKAAQGVTMTADALSPYIAVLSKLGPNATFVDADNALTAAGLLQVEDLPESMKAAQPSDISGMSEAAQQLHRMLADATFASESTRLAREHQTGNLSDREYARQLNMARHTHATRPTSYAIAMTKAIETRDVDYLLRIVDQASGNETSKEFMFKRYDVKIKGLNREKRRAAIFSFCGFTAEQQALYEAKIAQAKNTRLQDLAAKDATEQAERVNVRAPDGIKTMRQFVDDAVSNGFSKLVKYRRGHFQWHLFNPDTKMALGLSVTHGGLAYARDALHLSVLSVA
ncbi:hypothetical protein KDW40_19145 [Burkholderia cenocepacia]|uniref:hypothetical protein n=1 Tax=Burkholderia cenocepacia TaxID=95486 RepID=UPI001B9E0D86|nr:hypothetical protein [Burkholderia cenocepacia]MBR8327848.1 hypothetical protein [Burkholderia cenocepacia]